jgi:predicted DNA-binding transcriptional regulator YafY
MILSGLEEIERAVLSWGTHATVIRPESLRARLAQIAHDLCAKYGPVVLPEPLKEAA